MTGAARPGRAAAAGGRVRRAGLRLVLAACACAATAVSSARQPPPTEPKFLRLSLADSYVGFEIESDDLKTSLDGVDTRDRYTDYSPMMGLQVDGSVYHPNLLKFNAGTELGYTWGERELDNGLPGGKTTEDRNFKLSRYNLALAVLAEKPVSASLFADKGRDDRDYDRFNRNIVDTESYGGTLSYNNRLLPMSLRYDHHEEDSRGEDRHLVIEEDRVNFQASSRRRASDRTSLRYTYEDYFRQEQDYTPNEGIRHYLYLDDAEYFGASERTRLLSSVTYNDIDQTFLNSRDFSVTENLRIDLRENLWTGGRYQYSRRESADADASIHNGSVFLEHQLYESLRSLADFMAERGEADSSLSSEEYLRFGPGLTETYTKRIGARSRLSVDLGLRYEQEDLDASGSQVRVPNEPVELLDGRPSFLRYPQVQPESVVVKDSTASWTYLEGLDYRVIPRGAYTEIQRVFGGAIPNGSVVLVDYTAAADTSDRLSRFENRAAVRLDLLDRLLSLYADHREVDSQGGTSLRFQDYRDDVLGVKSLYRWLEVGAEYFNRESDGLSYDGTTLFADLSWHWDASSLNLHAMQTKINYEGEGDDQDTTLYSAQYEMRPLRHWSFQLYAARYLEGGRDDDRQLDTEELHAIYTRGKLNLDAMLRFEQEDNVDETRDRQYFFLTTRRRF